MNAIDFLINEHDKVRRVLSDISNDSHHTKTKRKMFDDLCQEIIRHEAMEHQVWYPHFKNNQRLDDTVKHLIKEEKTAEIIIRQFQDLNNDESWEGKFSKFREQVEHYAQEEETKLFPVVKQLLSDNELDEIGLEMHHFKKEYQHQEK